MQNGVWVFFFFFLDLWWFLGLSWQGSQKGFTNYDQLSHQIVFFSVRKIEYLFIWTLKNLALSYFSCFCCSMEKEDFGIFYQMSFVEYLHLCSDSGWICSLFLFFNFFFRSGVGKNHRTWKVPWFLDYYVFLELFLWYLWEPVFEDYTEFWLCFIKRVFDCRRIAFYILIIRIIEVFHIILNLSLASY